MVQTESNVQSTSSTFHLQVNLKSYDNKIKKTHGNQGEMKEKALQNYL